MVLLWFETYTHYVALDGFEPAVLPRVALTFHSFCLTLPLLELQVCAIMPNLL